MKFYDKVNIIVQSGKGGDGIIAGRREKGEAWGGPAGGDGGKGGSVIFVASKNEYTLMPYKYRKKIKAKNGAPGKGNQQYGSDADDIVLLVPEGTLIKETSTQKILSHLKNDGDSYVVAKGGRGGIGNIHFKTPSNQYPIMCLLGEPGIKKEITLELQLLGDLALIGTPSVGKSTLINAISNTKAKTASYAFTTLIPNIGVVEHKGKSFTVVDVPGLISGASEGKGLGDDFLRHILKARIWCIILDASKDIEGIKERSLLLREIFLYIEKRFHKSREFGSEIEEVKHCVYWRDKNLRYESHVRLQNKRVVILKKIIITIVNKYDFLDEELWVEYAGLLAKHICTKLKESYQCDPKIDDIVSSLLSISALTYEYIPVFLDRCIALLANQDTKSFMYHEQFHIEDDTMRYIKDISQRDAKMLLEGGYIDDDIYRKAKVREIYDKQIAYLTFVLPRGNDEAEMRYRKNLQKQGYLDWFQNHGIKRGDVLKIVSPYEGEDDKYILRS